MLIITDRHTKADLELWKDYEEIDHLNKYSERKVEMSIEIIKNWSRNHAIGSYMVSWGKDSVVLLHLIMLTGLNWHPIVYMRFGSRDNPDCEKVRDEFFKKFPYGNYHEDFFKYEEVRKTGGHWKALAKKYGNYRVTGIRNDESGKRQLQWRLNGFESEHSCRPLSLWTNQEIFAYIEQNNLPLCPVYGYLGGGRWRREMIRTHSLAGSTGNGIGRDEWEREYYLDILARIKKGGMALGLRGALPGGSRPYFNHAEE